MSHPLTLPFFHTPLSYRFKHPNSQHLVPYQSCFHFRSAPLCLSPMFYPSQCSFLYCMRLHNFYLSGFMLPSRLKCDSCTCPANMHRLTQTHIHTSMQPSFSFLAHFCLPLFSFALPRNLDSSASVLSQALQPQGLNWKKGRWVKRGETERQSESKSKRRRECKGRRTTSFAVPVLHSPWRME